MLTLWVVLFAVWMVANATLAIEVGLTGAAITFVLAYCFAGDAWRQVSWTPRSVYHFLAYTGTFVVEMVKANINMLGYVYSPRLAIKPGIVRVRTQPEVADRPAGACQLHRADAWFLDPRHQG